MNTTTPPAVTFQPVISRGSGIRTSTVLVDGVPTFEVGINRSGVIGLWRHAELFTAGPIVQGTRADVVALLDRDRPVTTTTQQRGLCARIHCPGAPEPGSLLCRSCGTTSQVPDRRPATTTTRRASR